MEIRGRKINYLESGYLGKNIKIRERKRKSREKMEKGKWNRKNNWEKGKENKKRKRKIK